METNRRALGTKKYVGTDRVPVFQNSSTDEKVWEMLFDFQKISGKNMLLTKPQRLMHYQTGRMGNVFSCCGLVAFYRPQRKTELFAIKAGKSPINLCTCVQCEKIDLYLMRRQEGSCEIAKWLRKRTSTQ